MYNSVSTRRDRQQGQAAIIVLLIFSVASLLGIVHGAEESDPKKKEHSTKETRASRREVKGEERSASGLSTEASPHKSAHRVGEVVGEAKPAFAPQFNPYSAGGSRNSSLRITAEKENSSQAPRHGGKTLPGTIEGTGDLERLPRETLQNQKHRSRNEYLREKVIKNDPQGSAFGFNPEVLSSEVPSKQGVSAIPGDKSPKVRERQKMEGAEAPLNDVPKVEFKKNSGDATGSGVSTRRHLQDSSVPRVKSPTERGMKSSKGLEGGVSEEKSGHESRNRVHLDRVPVAPKPELKVTLPQNVKTKTPQGSVQGRPRIEIAPSLKLSAESRLKISQGHHADFKPNRNFKNSMSQLPVEKNGVVLEENLKRLNLKPRPQPDFQRRLQEGNLLQLTNGKHAKSLHLMDQFQEFGRGDFARRMNLSQNLQLAGGWQNRKMGLVGAGYTSRCMSSWYPGPGCYPSYCWYPVWTPWVDWCWWDNCSPWFDPRPIYCRPVVWMPAPVWGWSECPTWLPLPIVSCGTWVDVPPVVVNQVDLQMLAVRFVDPGHLQQERGPRYRVWLRNNSPVPVNQPFNVTLFASDDQKLLVNRSESGVRVERIDAGQTMSVDLRLPEGVNFSSLDNEGNPMPFRYLTVQVDSHHEISENDVTNNGAMLPRGEVLPVDPAAFAANPSGAETGGMVTIAGEGFGPEPGQVIVQIGGLEMQGEIEGWYDLGVRIRLPMLSLISSVNANVVVVRGDGAAANSISLEVVPVDTVASY